jgi:hypothetical protein
MLQLYLPIMWLSDHLSDGAYLSVALCFNSLCCVNLYAGLYLYSATESKLTVDTSRGERLHINVSANAHSVIPNFPYNLV